MFLLIFFVATQDIAVDGMLRPSASSQSEIEAMNLTAIDCV
jgi:hypothetical protein